MINNLYEMIGGSRLVVLSLSNDYSATGKCWFQNSDFGFYMIFTVVLYASYEIKSCLLLNDFVFSCCFMYF